MSIRFCTACVRDSGAGAVDAMLAAMVRECAVNPGLAAYLRRQRTYLRRQRACAAPAALRTKPNQKPEAKIARSQSNVRNSGSGKRLASCVAAHGTVRYNGPADADAPRAFTARHFARQQNMSATRRGGSVM